MTTLIRSASSPMLSSMHGATGPSENKPTTSAAFTNSNKLPFHRDPPSLPRHIANMRRSSSAGSLHSAVPIEEVGQDSPTRFADRLSIRPQRTNKSRPMAKLEPIPSFSIYNKDGKEDAQEEDDEDDEIDGEDFSFPTTGAHNPDVGEADEITGFGSLNNVYGRSISFPTSSLERRGPNLSALYMATGLGISGPPPTVVSNDFDNQRLQQHYEKLVKENPSNSLILRNYARYLCMIKRDYKRGEEFYSRAILVGPDDGEVLSEYASLCWQVRRDREKASSYFQRALKISPENSHVLAAYASFLWETDGVNTDQLHSLHHDEAVQPCYAKH